MKQYGHIPATPPPAQTADGGRRSPVTGAAVIAVRKNPCRNTAENLRMCESCINTHTHTQKFPSGNKALRTFFFHVQGGYPPYLFTLNFYSHANIRF